MLVAAAAPAAAAGRAGAAGAGDRAGLARAALAQRGERRDEAAGFGAAARRARHAAARVLEAEQTLEPGVAARTVELVQWHGAILMRLAARLLDLLVPPRCVGCGARDSWLCHACRAELPRL